MKEERIVHVFVGIVHNSKGEILLLNRKEKELPEADGRWELPGGKVDFGETPELSVEREMYEEAGAHVKADYLLAHPFISLWHYPNFDQHTVIMCFVCKFYGIDLKQNFDHHVNEIIWASPLDICKYETLPGVNQFINLYKNK